MFFPSLEPYVDYVYDPDGYQRHLSRVRACIEDNVDEWVTSQGAGFRRLQEQEAAFRRHFVGQRVRLRISHPNNVPGRKLLPKWQLDWYIAKFVPGTHYKTVVLRRYPLREEKVISTDFIVPDPVQPDVVPPLLDIVKLDPPAEEAPQVAQFPFREELAQGNRPGPGDQDDRVEDVNIEPGGEDFVDVPYVYGGQGEDPLAEEREDLFPRAEDSGRKTIPELEAPIPVPVRAPVQVSVPQEVRSVSSRTASSATVSHASSRTASSATVSHGPMVEQVVPEQDTVEPASDSLSRGSEQISNPEQCASDSDVSGSRSRSEGSQPPLGSEIFHCSTPTHTVSAPPADFNQLLSRSSVSSRHTVSAPPDLGVPETLQQRRVEESVP
ncbi:hypothetical protein FOZ62_008703, partial [Perkinsus olseni]